jgi:hypothetical protein
VSEGGKAEYNCMIFETGAIILTPVVSGPKRYAVLVFSSSLVVRRMWVPILDLRRWIRILSLVGEEQEGVGRSGRQSRARKRESERDPAEGDRAQRQLRTQSRLRTI